MRCQQADRWVRQREGTYNFNKVATTMRTNEAMLVAVPFIATEMAVDQFPLARRVVC